MFEAFSTSLTGLNAFKEQISTISNNVSNAETTAYKSEGLSFSEILSGSMSETSTGGGVSVQSINTDWTQGSLTSTGSSTDLAITGSGLFVVTSDSGVTYYTRDGSFNYDSDKNLVTSDGYAVQGYAIDDEGELGSVGDISLAAVESITATATTEISTTLNLNSATDSGETYSTSISVYDSLGNEIPVTMTFTKSSTTNEWTWSASISSDYGTASGSGTLDFDSSGALEGTTDPTITLSLTTGATASQTITWSLYGSGATNNTLTQYASTSATSSTSQDGNAAGTLVSTSIDSDGVITGSYSNGEKKELFQIALATFTNLDGLRKTGDNLYSETAASGSATIAAAGTDSAGYLTSGSLELSNVDMAEEMSNAIIAQRAYESCAKMITVENEILQVTVNMLK